ncbi:MAG TPA: hypothetical protein VHJ79_15875 [Mycobacterium sp.]|jgi:hypothetical protein|nr:hypothetical protein [Mycobacterium sp.]
MPAPRCTRRGCPCWVAKAVEHIHAHLDRASGTISPLHTHDATGVIHIESPVKRQFSLRELFSDWDVSLSTDNIGALRAADGTSLRVFVNGTQRTGNPAAITFGPHDEIAVARRDNSVEIRFPASE